jgi:hypothetical protein
VMGKGGPGNSVGQCSRGTVGKLPSLDNFA